jgi:hypothetical protein
MMSSSRQIVVDGSFEAFVLPDQVIFINNSHRIIVHGEIIKESGDMIRLKILSSHDCDSLPTSPPKDNKSVTVSSPSATAAGITRSAAQQAEKSSVSYSSRTYRLSQSKPTPTPRSTSPLTRSATAAAQAQAAEPSSSSPAAVMDDSYQPDDDNEDGLIDIHTPPSMKLRSRTSKQSPASREASKHQLITSTSSQTNARRSLNMSEKIASPPATSSQSSPVKPASAAKVTTKASANATKAAAAAASKAKRKSKDLESSQSESESENDDHDSDNDYSPISAEEDVLNHSFTSQKSSSSPTTTSKKTTKKARLSTGSTGSAKELMCWPVQKEDAQIPSLRQEMIRISCSGPDKFEVFAERYAETYDFDRVREMLSSKSCDHPDLEARRSQQQEEEDEAVRAHPFHHVKQDLPRGSWSYDELCYMTAAFLYIRACEAKLPNKEALTLIDSDEYAQTIFHPLHRRPDPIGSCFERIRLVMQACRIN